MGRFFLCAASQLVLLAWLNAFADSSAPGNPGKFVAILFAAGAAYWLLVASFENVPAKWRALIFWTVAIVLRVVVFPMPPGDDVWRYIWEGKIQLHGFNPYLLGPQAPVLESLRDAGWEKINHPEWAAIYPPAAELGFALLSRISATPWFYKAAFAAADLFTLFFLLRLNTGPGRYRHTAWYAWNPALILAFAGMAHFDSLLLLAMTVSIWALHRADPMGEREPSWTWSVISAVFLGLAIALKTIPVFLLPAWLFALKRRSIVLTISIANPVFLSSMYGGLGVVTKSLREFAYVSRFNDLVWWLVEKCALHNRAARGCLRARGDLSQGLASERALGAGRGVDSQSGAASVVRDVDSSAGLLAQTAGVVRALVERFRLRSAGGKRRAAPPSDRLDGGGRSAVARVDLPIQTEAGQA